MARINGEAGKHQADTTRQRLNRLITLIVCAVGGIGFACGICINKSNLWALILLVTVVSSLVWMHRYSNKQIRQIGCDRKGETGETRVATFLAELPDTYWVFNDMAFADSYGNIDHIVIGPTGFFAIDTKNWNGVVTADGKGELCLNHKPTDKPLIKRFVRRAMELRNRIKALKRLDLYIQALFVFPYTGVDAKWGSTGAVHCMHASQLEDYILGKEGKTLSPQEVNELAKCIKLLVETK